MREIWALATKDLRLLVRDKGGLFFTFFFPILYAVFFGSVMAGSGGGGDGNATKILVVDEDNSLPSGQFVALLDAESQLAVTPISDRDAAGEAVRKGNSAAFVVLPEGFGTASIFQGEPIKILVGVDPSRKAAGGLIQGLITAKAYEQLQSRFFNTDSSRTMAQDAIASLDEQDLNPAQKLLLRSFLSSLDTFLEKAPDAGVFGNATEDQDGSGGFNPIEIEAVELLADGDDTKPNPYAIAFPQGVIWGIMGCAAGFGISLVAERNRGTLTRLRTAPMARSRVLLGKGLACFLTTLTVAVSLLVIARVAFEVVPGSLPLLALAVLSIATAFVGIMMLLSTIGRTEASAGGIGWALMIVMAMFGGGMIPLMFMNGWMITASHFSPVKWSILAMEGAIWRGFTLGDMLLPCGILIGVGITGFVLGSKMFDWSEP